MYEICQCQELAEAPRLDVMCSVQERYYSEKLQIKPKDPAGRRKVVEDFIQVSFKTHSTAYCIIVSLCLQD